MEQRDRKPCSLFARVFGAAALLLGLASAASLAAAWGLGARPAGVLVALAAPAAAAGVLYGYLARVLRQPLAALRQEAEAMAGGDLAHRVAPAGEDELGRVAAALHALAERVAPAARAQAEVEELRRRLEAQREELAQRLALTARAAGTAEMATGVLHNVGNVLNSVNVSTTLLADRLKRSRLPGLTKAAALVQDHAGNLPGFFGGDQRGQQLPGYLVMLSEHLQREQTEMLEELGALARNVDHIKEIVAMQQSYAKVAGVVETIQPAELMEDAVRINLAGLQRHGITLERRFAAAPPVQAEKHKVLQVLVNLISNAKYAVDAARRDDKKVTLVIEPSPEIPGGVRLQVQDNGVGIAAEHLPRMFTLGFTTRPGGHGFGLHSALLAARDMGGRLTVHSDGPGRGATFTLELPAKAGDTVTC